LDLFRRMATDTLNFFQKTYDYILLDAQSGSDRFAQVAISLSHEIVIVSEFDPISLEGIDRLRYLFRDSLPYNRTWILFNKVLPEFSKPLGELSMVARYLPPIPWDAEVVRSFARRRLALDMKSGNTYTLSIMQTASQLLGDEVGQQIEKWKSSREQAIREPVREQLQETEEIISLTEDAIVNTEFEAQDLSRRSRRILAYFTAIAITAFSGIEFVVISGYALNRFFLPLIGGGLAALVAVLFYVQSSQTAWRNKRRFLEGQRRSLETRLEDLKERRARLRILSDSSLEALVKKSRESDAVS
jgi:uncharacterized protein YbjQ (UPF0145 family)